VHTREAVLSLHAAAAIMSYAPEAREAGARMRARASVRTVLPDGAAAGISAAPATSAGGQAGVAAAGASGHDFSTMDGVLRVLNAARRIVVVAGAGMSTASGVPDFRSPGSGLYDVLASSGCRALACVGEPQEVFDLGVFREDPAIFYSVAPLLYAGFDKAQPSLCHRWLASLAAAGRVLRLYTQNVDGLDTAAGLAPPLLVECHGSLRTAACIKCGRSVPAAAMLDDARAGRVPHCPAPKCARRPDAALKPNAVFFNEALPFDFDAQVAVDCAAADCVIVLGTSLRVKPLSGVTAVVPARVPLLLVNGETVSVPLAAAARGGSSGKSVVGHGPGRAFDCELLGDCDAVAHLLWSRMTGLDPIPATEDSASERASAPMACSSLASSEAVDAGASHSQAVPATCACRLCAAGISVLAAREPPARFRVICQPPGALEGMRASAAAVAATRMVAAAAATSVAGNIHGAERGEEAIAGGEPTASAARNGGTTRSGRTSKRPRHAYDAYADSELY
jgi:NAD-dependent SIR2 family protein deacetylase